MSDSLDSTYPLHPLVKGWIAKIKAADKFKEAHFGEQAKEAMTFYECGKELNDLMWKRDALQTKGVTDEEDLPAPKFRMVVGKVAEVVELFGPALYHRNPSIVVEPKTLDIPIDLLMQTVPPQVMQQAQMQAQQTGQPFNPENLFPPDPLETQNKITALLLNYFLDYIQRENSKYKHSRQMIDEALIKGAGLLWTETFEHYEGGPTMVGSFYDTIDYLYIDPDAETLDDAKWCARECWHPVWQVAEEYGIEEDMLEKRYGTIESAQAQGESESNDEWKRARKVGKTNDLVRYWKIYSKMGMGHKLSKMDDLDDVEGFLDSMGMNCYIVVAEKIPYPLNLKQSDVEEYLTTPDEETQTQLEQQLFHECQWPIPFWADGEWPFTLLGFHDVPNNPWPMSHIKPGMGQLKFLNWVMSFLASKIRTACRTVAAVMKGMETEVRDRLLSGKDYEVVEIPSSMLNGDTSPDVGKIVQFLTMPPFHGDIWKVVEAVAEQFEKATGLTELAYGAPGGMRSAAEAQAKQGNMNIRPDDMANKVEDVMSLIARKEAMAARWVLEPDALMPVLGQRGTQLWAQYVMSGDVNKVSREYNYRVEAGSTRKPNKETQQANINAAIQQWMPAIQMEMQKGNVQYVNAFIEQWCKAFDIEPKKFLLPQPAPQPNPEQQKIQMEMQQSQQESQMKMQELQQKMQMDREKQQADIASRQQEMQLDAQAGQQEIAMEREKHAAEMQMRQQEMMADIQTDQIEAGLKLRTDQALAAQKIQQGQMQMRQQAIGGLQDLQHSAHEHAMKLHVAKQQAKLKPKPPGGAK